MLEGVLHEHLSGLELRALGLLGVVSAIVCSWGLFRWERRLRAASLYANADGLWRLDATPAQLVRWSEICIVNVSVGDGSLLLRGATGELLLAVPRELTDFRELHDEIFARAALTPRYTIPATIGDSDRAQRFYHEIGLVLCGGTLLWVGYLLQRPIALLLALGPIVAAVVVVHYLSSCYRMTVQRDLLHLQFGYGARTFRPEEVEVMRPSHFDVRRPEIYLRIHDEPMPIRLQGHRWANMEVWRLLQCWQSGQWRERDTYA